MRQSTIDKIYKKTRKKYPEIKSETQIETIVRKRIFRRKLLTAFLLFLLSNAILLFLPHLHSFFENPQSKNFKTIQGLFEILGGGLGIASVMIFAKSLHDPLTPSESREFKEKETYEKTGHK